MSRPLKGGIEIGKYILLEKQRDTRFAARLALARMRLYKILRLPCPYPYAHRPKRKPLPTSGEAK